MAQDQDKKAGKPTPRTRLNNEIAFRYGNPNAATRTARRKPGEASLTEDLAAGQDAELGEAQEPATDQEAAAPEPTKSLFELPRKEPARPTLLGGGVEADAATVSDAPSDTPPTRSRR